MAENRSDPTATPTAEGPVARDAAARDVAHDPAGRRREQGERSRAASGRAAAPDIRDLEILAHWLDSRFHVPGTRIRFGLDSVLGLVPGIGDAATTVPAAYILFRAHRIGVPRTVLVRMGWNVAMDLMVGSIPLVGDLFDLAFKANRRNLELLRQHVGQPADSALRDPVQGSV